MLDEYNVLTQSFRRVRDALQLPENENLRLRISGSRVENDRRYELPTGTDLAGLIPGDFEPDHGDRDIIVSNKSTGLTRITSLNPLFDSLHFPLLFPYGNDGYHEMIRYNPLYVDPKRKRGFGDLNSQNLGNIILPATFTGGVRYMMQLYQDAISICQFHGNPDLFITFTCNAQWPELVNAFKDIVDSRSEDKPMLVARVFKMRLSLLREDLKKKQYFGRYVAGGGDVFYLRMLLCKIPGALSFEHLRTVNGILCKDYQTACQALGLLSNDDEWHSVMAEVTRWAMPPLIRSTFVALLVFCEVTSPTTLFASWWMSMADDFKRRIQRLSNNPVSEPPPELLRDEVLQNLQGLLQNYSSSLSHFGLPLPTIWDTHLQTDDLISQQLQYDASHEDNLYNSYRVSLNSCQQLAHDAVLGALASTTGKSVAYIRTRAIVTPTNQVVSSINDYVLTQIPGDEKIYLSSDTLTTPGPNQTRLEAEYPVEFLNALTFNGMPEHQLRLKPYAIVMLLRNLNPSAGLCNGTRILLTHLGEHTLRGLIIGGSFEGTIAIIPRIVLDKTDPNWPFTLKRRQYPVRLCYAVTINKSQGKTLEHIGIYLPNPVFSHGQLYVALSRARSVEGVHISIQNDANIPETSTRNIVYKEIFEDLQDSTHVP
ncbi:ATP-dependent DNA helicase PIF1 [Linum perenne]